MQRFVLWTYQIVEFFHIVLSSKTIWSCLKSLTSSNIFSLVTQTQIHVQNIFYKYFSLCLTDFSLKVILRLHHKMPLILQCFKSWQWQLAIFRLSCSLNITLACDVSSWVMIFVSIPSGPNLLTKSFAVKFCILKDIVV